MKAEPPLDDFERWLRSQTPAAPPPAWRETILAEARLRATMPAADGDRSNLFQLLRSRWAWLQPRAVICGGATLWLAIAVLGWIGRYEPDLTSSVEKPPVLAASTWLHRHQMLERLLQEETFEEPAVIRRSGTAPRSQAAQAARVG